MGAAGSNVLIVDDHDLVAQALADGVRLAGYGVCGIAATAAAALELMRRHRPSLAVVDVNLEREGSGVELARRLTAIAPLGIIYVTGYPEQVETADVGHAWLVKPYRVLDLINGLRVVEALSRRTPIDVPIPA